MKVSVVMCSYNVSRFIDQAIQSIVQQTYQDWELIISDDCSTDNTVELIKPYLSDSRIKLVQQPKNLGYVRNKNTALQMATGELITQLDSDDSCHAERLEKQVAAFKAIPELKACGTGFNVIEENNSLKEKGPVVKEGFITELMQEYPFSLVGIMMPKDVWETSGYLNEYFAGSVGEDIYLVWHINLRYPIYCIPDQLYSYRINHNSVTHTYDNPRKLIGGLLLIELHRQLTTTGTDWLAEGKWNKARAYEQELLANNGVMAERYRIWAAKAINKESFSEANKFLAKSLSAKFFHPRTLSTIHYYLRKRFF